MNKERIQEILDDFERDIEYLERELKKPEYIGKYISIRSPEVARMKILLNYIYYQQKKIDEAMKKLNEVEKILLGDTDE